jgi:hypothetical protein
MWYSKKKYFTWSIMKKLTLFLLSVVALSACTPKPPSAAPENQTEEQAAKEFEEIGKAIEAGKSARCVMTKKDSKETMTYVVKGKKIKMSGASMGGENQSGGMLSDEQYVYTWNDSTKEGVKFKVTPTEDSKNTLAEQSKTQDIPDFSDEKEKQKYEDLGYSVNCQVTNVPDSEFTPPTGIKFTDMSLLMEQSTKMKPGTTPSAANQAEMEKQLQDAMKQYGQGY